MKRILSMLLVLLILAGMLVACQSDVNPPANPDDSSAASDSGVKDSSEAPTIGLQTGTDENGYPLDRLPEMDYKGKTVSILSWSDNKELTYPDEAGNGSSPIQEQLYYHWRAVEARLGIQFKPSWVPGYIFQKEGILYGGTREGCVV